MYPDNEIVIRSDKLVQARNAYLKAEMEYMKAQRDYNDVIIQHTIAYCNSLEYRPQ